ncbi:MAG TPA: hypothetical protein VEY09_10915 [Pyrinomonadaceae bacterium]|nr:hypothetical protein [Pyrinomonadaceae bacterium]
MAVVLAGLSLPPLSALAWCGLSRLSAESSAAALSCAAAGREAGAFDAATHAEPETHEAAGLLLPFGVRRADGTRAAAEPAEFAPAETAVAQGVRRSDARPEVSGLRASAQARAAGTPAQSRARDGGRGPAPAARRRQEKRLCASRRVDSSVVKAAANERPDFGEADAVEHPAAPTPAACQTEAVSGRSRTRL